MSGPLTGIRVVDCTTVFSGPICTVLLADAGADVVKLEDFKGDVARSAGPAPAAGMSPPFMALGRNKRSLSIDLKRPGSQDVLARLLDTADVVVHNMRTPAAEKLGLGPSIRDRNPGLIHLAITGFGSAGPYAGLRAYDDLIQAASGMVAVQSMYEERLSYIRTAIADKIAGHLAYGSICAALVQKQRTGIGCAIEVPMFEMMTSWLLIEHLYGRTFVPPTGGTVYERIKSPDRRPFQTKDGWLSVMLYSDKDWSQFFEAVGQPELMDDPRYGGDFVTRTAYAGELYKLVASEMLKRTNEEWLKALSAADAPVFPVTMSIDDLLNDPHLRAVGLFQEEDHPTQGKYIRIRNPVRFSSGLEDNRLQPPVVGQHTTEILEELGYGAADIAKLIASGDVKAAA